MKPWVHAKNSVRKFGGKPEDYIKLHEWFDQTKSAHADMRHRAILHNAMGIYIAVDVFGDSNGNMTNSDGVEIPVREVGEQHVLEDMGRIPSLTDYLSGMPMYSWLGGPKRTIKKIAYGVVD
jgi:hypothetical protein